jgi:AGCS family alanine or glycine:cation symporter
MVGPETRDRSAQSAFGIHIPQLHCTGVSASHLPCDGLHSREQRLLQAPAEAIDHLGFVIHGCGNKCDNGINGKAYIWPNRRPVMTVFSRFFLALTLLVATAYNGVGQDQKPTIDDRINAAVEPVTKAITEVVFFSITIDEEIELARKADGRNVFKMIVDDSGPQVELGAGKKALKNIPIFIYGKADGSFDLSYVLTIGDVSDTTVIANQRAGVPVVFEKLNNASLVFNATPDQLSGEPYRIVYQNVKIPFVLLWLIAGAVFFTVFFRFVNISGFRHALAVVRGKYDNPNHSGEVSHFQALTAALSGTVGIGNIAGVAVAVSVGGPGATFWMIVAGLLGMSMKFVECTLGVKYRKKNADGSVSGGPMYYLSRGLAKRGFGGTGKVLAVVFAIACIGGSFGGGNMVQINQATEQLIQVTGGSESFLYNRGWLFGTAMAVLVGIIIIGGIKSIARVTDKVVPFMVGIYVLGALVVIFANVDQVPFAFGRIFEGAFAAEAMYGGMIGVLIQGFRRAAFSNEAGIGSASIAHSAAKTDEPISEGLVSLLEPFIDTVVICTMTALVIVISDYGDFTATEVFVNNRAGELDAISLTSSSFSQTISWFPPVLSAAVILFALSTMISWSYYGLKAWTYLFGESKRTETVYKALFLVFVVVGSAISAKQVFDFGDAMIFAMCFPNVLGLYFLAPELLRDLRDYRRRVKSGEIKRYT